MPEYGKYFRRCRLAAGIKQTTAAKLLGVAQSAISQYENDKHEPTLDIVVRMTEVYGCTLDDLLGVTDIRSR